MTTTLQIVVGIAAGWSVAYFGLVLLFGALDRIDKFVTLKHDRSTSLSAIIQLIACAVILYGALELGAYCVRLLAQIGNGSYEWPARSYLFAHGMGVATFFIQIRQKLSRFLKKPTR